MENLFLQQFLELLDTGAWSASTVVAVEEAGGLSYLQAGLRARRWPRPRYRRKEIPSLATYPVAFGRCYQCVSKPRGADSAVHNSLWVLLLQGDLERVELLHPQPADYVEIFCRALDVPWAGHLIELVEPRLDAACTRRRLMLRLCKHSLRRQRLDLFCKLLTRLDLPKPNQHLLVLPLALMALKADPQEGVYLERVLACLELAPQAPHVLHGMVACVVKEWGLSLSPAALRLLLRLRAYGVPAIAFVPAVCSLEKLKLLLEIEPQFPLESLLEGLFEESELEVLAYALQRVPPHQRPHPLKLARAAQRGANLAGFEILETLHPQLSLETAVHRGSPGGLQISDQGSPDRDLICDRVLARARRLWKQFLPLMRAMVVQILQHRVLSLQTRIELGLISDEARWTMLSWWMVLTKIEAYPISELVKIPVASATPGLLQNYLRGLFQQGLGQEIPLGLGFGDPVEGVPLYNLYQAARFCVAYGKPAEVVRLVESGRLTPGQLHSLHGVAVNYGRSKILGAL